MTAHIFHQAFTAEDLADVGSCTQGIDPVGLEGVQELVVLKDEDTDLGTLRDPLEAEEGTAGDTLVDSLEGRAVG